MLKKILLVLYITIILIGSYYFFNKFGGKEKTYMIKDPITVTNEPKSNIPEYQTIVIFSGDLGSNKGEISIDHYPKIIINNIDISDINLYIEVEPIEKIKNYGYFKSSSCFFAFRFFIGDLGMGGYYNVFRNDRNGVSNDLSRGLNGAIAGNTLLGGYTWNIPLNKKVPIARNQGQYGYTYIDIESYLLSNISKELYVGGYLSSIKEFGGGRQITNIKKIIITYKGDPDSIKVIK